MAFGAIVFASAPGEVPKTMRALLLAIALIVLASPTLAAKRIALLIGNQDYKRGVGKLVNPLKDVRIVGDALRSIGFEVLEPVKNGTRVDILDAIQRYTDKLKDAGPDAIGFVYYSGHGIASKGANYLIPVEVERPSSRQLRAYGLKQSEILAILRKDASNAAHYVVIDACRNELKGARGAKGFLPVNQQSGTLIAFATAPGQTASDLGATSGPYAKALAAELVRPGVDDLNMFHRVKVAVSKATGGDQVPWTLDGIQRDQRPFFAGKPKQNRPFSNALTARLERMQKAEPEWKKIAGSTDRKKLRDFAKRYSGTAYDTLALAKLATLDRKIIKEVWQDRLKQKRENPPSRATKWRPGQTFRDCPSCPELVVVRAGSFMMGSNNGKAVEKPVRKVTIGAPLAVGKFEVTFAEWDACVADGIIGCSHKPGAESWGRGKRPVINVSWNDIKQYLTWLSVKTGKSYRLLTEAEWEYVARGGTTGRWSFEGDESATCNFANHADTSTSYDWKNKKCSDGIGKRTAEVGRYKPNPWGLYDVHGNVEEWVEDCYLHKDGYRGAPTDGAAVTSNKCESRVVRGGSWIHSPQLLRSANRSWTGPADRNKFLGFRVVRMLTP
jgi:formylglycine-generating enzyme required for sulfatase activity